MKGLLEKFFCRIHAEEGASAVEYGLLITGGVLLVMLAIYAIGGELLNSLSSVKSRLGGSG
jgi:Flp pilus assembly pilin Flp